MIFELSPASSQPPGQKAGTTAKLVHERAIALGYVVDKSSHFTYMSHLNSYINFCTLHGFSIEPTKDTMLFFVIYMCHHIRPDSVDSYLSGICNQLESAFPNIRSVHKSALVRNTLKGGYTRCFAPPLLSHYRFRLVIHSPPPFPLNTLTLHTPFNGIGLPSGSRIPAKHKELEFDRRVVNPRAVSCRRSSQRKAELLFMTVTFSMSKVLQWPGLKHFNNVTAKTCWFNIEKVSLSSVEICLFYTDLMERKSTPKKQ
ncbi:hypothetical protein C8R43DRAFT_952145 [Mycena crocata]|nr:hypothetical protein C8R43DRAFT_952145 [Mycena crocata]